MYLCVALARFLPFSVNNIKSLSTRVGAHVLFEVSIDRWGCSIRTACSKDDTAINVDCYLSVTMAPVVSVSFADVRKNFVQCVFGGTVERADSHSCNS